jgi:hypothetical protein
MNESMRSRLFCSAERHLSGSFAGEEGCTAKVSRDAATRNKRESMREIGGTMRDGAGKQVMKWEMCTENDKEGNGVGRQEE